MDGVLVHKGNEHLQRLNKAFDTHYENKDVVDFHYNFMTPPQRKFMFSDECWHRADLYDDVSLGGEDHDALIGLQELGRVICITSPLLGHIRSKYQWLAHYFDRRDIFLCSDKSLVRADLLVDDAIDNLKTWPEKYIIFDQPWNQGFDGPRVTKLTQLPPLAAALLDFYGDTR